MTGHLFTRPDFITGVLFGILVTVILLMMKESAVELWNEYKAKRGARWS